MTEIAELTGKNHADVLRDIRNMLEVLKKDASIFAGIYKDAYGRDKACFNLPKRETLILVSGYSTELRARIIDRWQELEGQVAQPAPLAIPSANATEAHAGVMRTYKAVSEIGLRYGYNLSPKDRPQNIQPIWFEDTFSELLGAIS